MTPLGNMDWDVMPMIKVRKEVYSLGLDFAHMPEVVDVSFHLWGRKRMDLRSITPLTFFIAITTWAIPSSKTSRSLF